jgi:hypothetical protein
VQVDFAFLADAAQESGGKLSALGVGIDRLHASQLPARHGRITLVARFSYEPSEAGTKQLAIQVVDAHGHAITSRGEQQLNLGVPGDALRGHGNLLVELVALEFRTYGPHEVTVTIDGEEFVMLPLEVLPRT